MKRGQLVLFIFLAVAVVYTFLALSEVEKERSPLPVSVQLSPQATEAQEEAVLNESKKKFSELIHKEANAVSLLTAHPEEVQKRLKDIAAQMKEEQVDILREKALDEGLNGDERFLSVYVLGESGLIAAQETLEEIATAPIPQLKDTRMLAQEEILRGQAIESLREADRLKRILTQSDNKFLLDRANRTLAYRQNKAASPEVQDQDALSKVLEKLSR